jgi:hypothetical protein
MAADPLVRPEYGPSLPAFLEARLRVPRRVTIGVAIALVVIAGAVAVLVAAGSADTRYVNHGNPVFNLRYAAGALRKAPPPPGWSLVLDSHRGGKFVQSIAVRRLTLPPHRGGVSAFLPIYADAYERAMGRSLTNFKAIDEGKARINSAPGYQITYTADRGGRTVFGRDVLLVPEDVPGAREGAVVRLLQTHAAGVHDARFVGTAGAVKKPYRSFRFGTDTSG